MSADPYLARELVDTLQAERAKRPKKNRRLTLAAVSETAECHDEVFQRVRAACCDEGYMDLDEHAALITLEVYKARSVMRVPPWRPMAEWLTEGEVAIPSGKARAASPSASVKGA